MIPAFEFGRGLRLERLLEESPRFPDSILRCRGRVQVLGRLKVDDFCLEKVVVVADGAQLLDTLAGVTQIVVHDVVGIDGHGLSRLFPFLQCAVQRAEEDDASSEPLLAIDDEEGVGGQVGRILLEQKMS